MAVFELKCPSLEYVYDMSWAEYLIRLHAFQRSEKRSLYKVREISWAATLGPHLNPKKLPKSKEKFWPLDSGSKNTDVTELMRDRIKKAKDEYLKLKSNGNSKIRS